MSTDGNVKCCISASNQDYGQDSILKSKPTVIDDWEEVLIK